MKKSARTSPQGTVDRAPAFSRDARVWIISDNPDLCRKLRSTLSDVAADVATLEPQAVRQELLRPTEGGNLQLIILDVAGPLDRSLEIIQTIRKARIQVAMVALTQTFSREFGVKIISQGVRYYFSHDYCEEEFLEVARSLLKK